MNYVDLFVALAEVGVDAAPKNISSKVVRRSFSAVFFMPVLFIIGVERTELPVQHDQV